MGPPPRSDEPLETADDFVGNKIENIRDECDRNHLRKAAEKQKRYYDLRVRSAVFQRGDLVWLWSPRRKKGRTPKWERRYTGPYTVIEQLGSVNHRIRKSAKAKAIVVHVDKLQKYVAQPGFRQERQAVEDNMEDRAEPVVAESEEDELPPGRGGRPARENRRRPTRYRE